MEQLVLDWSGPFKIKEPTPTDWYARIGLYAIEYDFNIIWIGKAEYQGARRETRRRRGLCLECLREELSTVPDEARLLIYIGTVSEEQRADLLGDAENLLIYKIKPLCNTQLRKRYRGVKPFLVVNMGNRPQSLSMRIQYPDP